MADNNRQSGAELEPKVEALEPRGVEKKHEDKEVREAKSEVGLEAGEIIEGAEVSSDDVSESEKKKKEGDSGGAATTGKAQATQIKDQKLPTVKKMTASVEKELKKEIKDLHKKVKQVMNKSGNLDAVELNSLMARLRQLKETLAELAYATADAIKELWYKYVQR